MLFLTIREMRTHVRRLAGTSLAVVLGVAFLTGTLVLGSTWRANFDDLFGEVNAGTDVVVRNSTDLGMDSPRGLIDASLVGDVVRVDGVAAAEPVVIGMGQLLGADGEAVGGNGTPQIAGSWTTDADLNPYRLAEGRAPEGHDEVVVNKGALEAGDLALGDTATVLTPEPVEATIVGVSTFGNEDGLGGVTFTAFDLDDAMAHIAKSSDGVSNIAVQAADGTSQDELAARIDRVLPAGLEATTGSEVTTEATDQIAETFLDMMLMFLTMFAGIALLVATFSIYNTFSIIVAQRTRQAALLRAIGARRGQVLRSVVFEALVVGLVAGIAMAGLLKGLFDALGFALPAGGTVIDAGTVVAGLVVGVVVTLVAGVFPAVKASRVAPLAALREVAVERTRPSRARIVVGTAVAAIGVGLTLVAALGDEDMLAAVGVGAVLTVVGAVVLGPVVARPAAALLGAPVVTLFTVFASSLRASLDDTLDRSFGGDLVINNGVFGGGGISPDMADELQALDEIDVAVGVGQGAADVDGSTKQLSIADPAALSRVVDLGVSGGSLDEVGDGALAVSDATAESNGWQLGDVVPLTFSDGRTEDLTIRATYETDDLAGGYLVPRSLWAPHAVQDIDQMVFVSASEGTSVADAKAAVTEVADRFGGPNVEDRDEFSATMTTGVDLMLGVVYALLALAIFIALMGIANTLSLAIHERTREIGLLRAVGQTRRQVRTTVRWESVVIATFGAVGGIALGVFLGWALVQAVGTASGGLGVFALPTGNLAIVLVVGAVAGVLAGLRPAPPAAP